VFGGRNTLTNVSSEKVFVQADVSGFGIGIEMTDYFEFAYLHFK